MLKSSSEASDLNWLKENALRFDKGDVVYW